MIRTKSAFTMVEILVAVFILSIILIMGAAATNMMVGKLRSKKTLDINTPIRNAFDIISQKMNTANTLGNGNIFGFREVGTDILAVANKSTDTKCTYIGKDGESLKMIQNNCTAPTSMSTGQIIVGNTVVVDSFSVDGKFMNTTNRSTIDFIPYATIKLVAHDKTDPTNTITLETSYYLDYQTVNNLK